MKRILSRIYAPLVVTASVLAFAACSNDEPQESLPQELPSFTNLTVAPGDSGIIEFNAHDVWKFASDKIWFKLDLNTGKAGNQKVAYTVTDDGLNFSESIATLTFQIGSQTRTFTATRSSRAREIKFFSRTTNEQTGDPEYKEIAAIDLTYQANTNSYLANFAVVANFDWKVSGPEWVSIDQDDMSGDANAGSEEDLTKLAYKWVAINYAKSEATDMLGELVFADRSASDKTTKLAVTCPGSNSYLIHSAAGTVTLNNKGQFVGSSVGGGTTTADSYDFTITAGNAGLKFFFIAKSTDGWYGLPGDASTGWAPVFKADWCTMVTTSEVLGPNVKTFSCKLSATTNDSDARHAAILAIPIAQATGLTEENLVNQNGDAILPQYQQYLITEVTQEGKIGLAYMYSKPEYLPGIVLGESDESVVAELPAEYRSLLSYSMTYNSVDQYTRQMSAVKLAGWNYKSDDSHLGISFIVNGELTTTPPTWFLGETSGMGPGSYMAFGFQEDPAWSATRSVWVVVQEYEFAGDEDQFVKNIMTVKVTQNANNYDEEE